MERVVRGIVMSVVCTLVILSVAVKSLQAASPDIVLRYAGHLPVDHHLTVNQYFFANLVMQNTKGKVQVQVFPDGQLFVDKDLPTALPAGAVEIGLASLPFWSGVEPGFTVLDLPYMFNDFHSLRRLLESEACESLKEDLRKRAGVKVLHWAYFGGNCLVSKKPQRTLEDLKGLRIRSAGEAASQMIRYLGASPTSLAGGEVYMSLQRGIIDGALTAISAIPQRKFWEVTKQVCYPYWTYIPFGVFINEKTWNSLPNDIQKIMLDAGKEAEMKSFNTAQTADEKALVLAKEKGMDIYYPSEQEKARLKETCKELYDLPAKRAGELGRALTETARNLR